VLVPILAFVVAAGLLQSPLTLYDSLSYHLFFPARWLQEQGVVLCRKSQIIVRRPDVLKEIRSGCE